jgi:hypothetical protein
MAKKKTIVKECAKSACKAVEVKNVQLKDILEINKQILSLFDKIKSNLISDECEKYNYAASQRARVLSLELVNVLKHYRKQSVMFANNKPKPTCLKAVNLPTKAKRGRAKKA